MSRLSLVTAAVLATALHAAPVGSALGGSGAPSGPPQEASPAPQAPQPRQPATHEPQTGQPGKDVIWLPTPEALVERMLTMAQVGPRDVLYDLGSGDGRLVLAAAKRGARAVGVEFNPDLVAFSESRARAQGVSDKARFVRGDIFETDFSEATVVTLYLLSTLNMRLRPKLLGMRPGTRVVSHLFTMDDWAPDEVSRVDQRPAYLWIVPAPVEGLWRVELAGGPSLDLALVQTFQKIEGTLTLGPAEVGLREPALRGDAIRLGFVDQAGLWYELTGTATGDRMAGSFQAAGRKGRWTADRRKPDRQSLSYSMPVLLTNASIVPSGDHDGTFIVP
jgi:SAM-dependent methyltransferase